MKKRNKAEKRSAKNERELDHMVAKTGLKGSDRELARQYGRGLMEGMRIACLAVAERLLRAGNTREEIELFFSDMLDSRDVEAILCEAEKRSEPKTA